MPPISGIGANSCTKALCVPYTLPVGFLFGDDPREFRPVGIADFAQLFAPHRLHILAVGR
jgi:hypothetical protein